jgi:hypothetical protein
MSVKDYYDGPDYYSELTHYWSQFGLSDHPDHLPHSGQYCACVWWSQYLDGWDKWWYNYQDPPDSTQDEWFITPEIDISELDNLFLQFYSVYGMHIFGASPGAHDYVKVSTDGGISWITVADLTHDDDFYFSNCTGGPWEYFFNFNEVPITLNLTRFCGNSSLLIAFQYEYKMCDIGGNRCIWSIDDLELFTITPDLECEGSLSWTDVEPGATIQGSFTVFNSGHHGTELDWEITEFPEWGEWTFTPSSGENLTPEDGEVLVETVVVAPNEIETEFEGEIKIVNTEIPDDFCIIEISLSTQSNQHSRHLNPLHFLQRSKE